MTTNNGWQPIRSGPYPMPREERIRYENTLNRLSHLAADLTHLWVQERCDDSDPSTLTGLLTEASAIQEASHALAEKVRTHETEYRKAHGEGDTIADPAEVLSRLPVHRVTSFAGGNGNNRAGWSLAFKPSDLPALAKLVGLEGYALNKATGTYTIAEQANPTEPAALELAALNARLEPLRQRGFSASIRVRKVTKVNVLCDLHIGGKQY